MSLRVLANAGLRTKLFDRPSRGDGSVISEEAGFIHLGPSASNCASGACMMVVEIVRGILCRKVCGPGHPDLKAGSEGDWAAD